VQRDKPRLAELRAPDSQHPSLKIDISKFEIASLTNAHAGDAQQPD
jgi:hypothetical protein